MTQPEIAGAEFQQKLLACVHCGFCLSACPTYTRLGDEADSPRGRLYLMRALVEGRLEADDAAVQTHIDRCVGCRACETVCPSGVEYGYLLERTRDHIAHAAGTSIMSRALLFAFGTRRMAQVISFCARALRATRIPHVLAPILPHRFGKLKFSLAMLAASSGSIPASPDVRDGRGERRDRPRVALLLGCVQEGLYGRVNRATEYVLHMNGYDVVKVPTQVCCGALHAHSGDLAGARDRARSNIEAFEQAGVDFIINNAAGCGAQMKQYAEILEHEPEWQDRAHAVSAQVRDLSEFLTGIELRPGGSLKLRVTYDAPCHLYHGQRITTAPLDVLSQIPDLTLVALPRADECCGGAGIYGLLHQDLGGRILKDKIDAVVSTGAEVVATPNPGCMMQIGAGLIIHGKKVAVVHPVELLAESYRRAK
jgi:glycolate oxidase iron-sulfur subunit